MPLAISIDSWNRLKLTNGAKEISIEEACRLIMRGVGSTLWLRHHRIGDSPAVTVRRNWLKRGGCEFGLRRITPENGGRAFR